MQAQQFRSVVVPVLFGLIVGSAAAAAGAGEIIFENQFENAFSASCDSVSLPSGISGYVDENWSTLYAGADYPSVFAAIKLLEVNRGEGLRLAITAIPPAGGSSPNGTLSYSENSAVPRAGFMTISRCPGDFRVNELNVPPGCDGVQTPCEQRCHSGPEAQGQLSLPFTLDGSTPPNRCHLQPGERYYMNIHFGGSATPGTDGAYCLGPVCAIAGGTQIF